MPTVLAEGLRFHYDERGSGRPLVLVHGTGADASAFDAASGLLAARGRRVIAYDRRGFSRTGGDPPRKKGYLRRHADDLAALLRELGAVPATLVGWSWGGLVALATAVHHSNVVDRLVLFEPPFHAKQRISFGMMRGVGGAVVRGKLGMKERGAKRFFRWALQRNDGSEGWDSLSEQMKKGLLANARGVLAELEAGTAEEIDVELLGRIRCPIAFVLGERSREAFHEAIDELRETFPAAPVVDLPHGDHASTVREPARWVEAVLRAMQ